VQDFKALGNGTTQCFTYDPPLYYGARSLLELTGILAGAGTADVTGTFQGYVMKD
jgi:hypothetical protein